GFAPEEMGDFIVARPDGIPIYNFAVTVDDHLMGITHVIRGEEHLSNTPRQLALYKAFNWVPPHFAHVPVVLAADRKKLSKRLHREAGLDVLHREGYLPEALLNYVALLGWSPGDGREIMSPDELIRLFSLERVSRGPAVFDLDKLNWMNERYLRSYPVEHLKELLEPYLGANQRVLGGEEHSPLPEVVIELMRERASTLSGLAAECRSFLEPPVSLGPEEAGVLAEDTASGVLGMFTEVLEAAPAGAVDWTALLDALRARSGLGMRKVYMPIRVAVTARRHGPELPVMLGILGRAEVLARVQRSLAAPAKAVD
ncbi:MAG: glutamate--tRNA ligase, partial [Firmicutes bacterium]|nr:glutamate--tRNA ligase [Bacillota bacterium]